ncbi:hypothetical protein ANG_0328 [Streptococcus anginosus subsp. whileyi MAS624]|nr:hypothetical protein ANG_0328 [Streptococcus anginosus subsp. whileyi MAS624]
MLKPFSRNRKVNSTINDMNTKVNSTLLLKNWFGVLINPLKLKMSITIEAGTTVIPSIMFKKAKLESK